ncbi:hypothetical protein [Nocardia sp. NPDC050710]|uniref:hypothetical protein n=1 Tax=Nocardia sp. NPDC050710 TaxID=3157220 RepID=UPI0033FA1522
MADPKFLPPESPIPAIPGGRTRSDVLVDGFPDVARRRIELEARLLEGACAFTDPGDGIITRDDVALLAAITAERFDPDLSEIRHRAVVALGDLVRRYDIDDAAAVLSELALSVVEHDGIRVAALNGLPPDRSARLADELADDVSPLVRGWVAAIRGGLPGRRPVPGTTERDPEPLPGEPEK